MRLCKSVKSTLCGGADTTGFATRSGALHPGSRLERFHREDGGLSGHLMSFAQSGAKASKRDARHLPGDGPGPAFSFMLGGG